MGLKYDEAKDLLKEIRSLELEMAHLPRRVVEGTYSYWYNITLNGVSASMADTGGDYDHMLMSYFDTCYRYGRYKRAEAENGEDSRED